MGAVEQAQLALLMRGDVLDDLHAHRLPCRAGAAEGVLHHPLPERFGDNRGGVSETGVLGHHGGGAVVGRRGDAVHHRGDDVHVSVEPGAVILLQALHQRRAQHVTIAGEVVAGDQCDRLLHAGGAAGLQCGGHAGHGRGGRVCAGAVALLRDGEGDHGGCWIAEQGVQGVGVIAGVHGVEHVDELHLVAVGAAHDQPVPAALAFQGAGHIRAAACEGLHGPASGTLRERQGVGARETANTDVDESMRGCGHAGPPCTDGDAFGVGRLGGVVWRRRRSSCGTTASLLTVRPLFRSRRLGGTRCSILPSLLTCAGGTPHHQRHR